MIVCLCHRVSDRDIVREARSGCASFEELQEFLLVGTACGACRACARDTFHAAAGTAACTGRSACSTATPHHAMTSPVSTRHAAMAQPA